MTGHGPELYSEFPPVGLTFYNLGLWTREAGMGPDGEVGIFLLCPHTWDIQPEPT